MFIHDNKDWTNFKWDSDVINPLVQRGVLTYGRLAGRMESIGFDTQLKATLEAVTNDVLATSEIEGVKLDSAQVRSSVARKLGVEIPDYRDPSHYVDGIVAVMVDALDYSIKSLTEERLFRWHAMLFPGVNIGMTVGEYRKDEMSVISGTFGRERVHYRAPSPDKVKGEMFSFLEWFNLPSNQWWIIKSAIAHLWFVCIHPFDDGNGRIARAISDMALVPLSTNGMRFYSLSRQILKDKNHYYKVLERTQRSATGDITEWLVWYIKAFIAAVEDSETILSGVLRKTKFWNVHTDKSITERQRRVLNHYLDGYEGKLTAKNWAKIAEVSKDTALRDINMLVKQGILIPTGGRVRDIPYSISYLSSNESDVLNHFSDVCIKINESGYTIIEANFRNNLRVADRLSSIDVLRYDNAEMSESDLVLKYFSYLV